MAILTAFVSGGARDGRTVADLVGELQVEATFPDGTKLVTLHDPIS